MVLVGGINHFPSAKRQDWPNARRRPTATQFLGRHGEGSVYAFRRLSIPPDGEDCPSNSPSPTHQHLSIRLIIMEYPNESIWGAVGLTSNCRLSFLHTGCPALTASACSELHVLLWGPLGWALIIYSYCILMLFFCLLGDRRPDRLNREARNICSYRQWNVSLLWFFSSPPSDGPIICARPNHLSGHG
ncbi:unnamed protein product [Somion occarium]|uniref:Uncharacterized protein n=1 Tax=Somion occarium TaxID=3059160 RepID=A0ABP1CUG7_9APHY